MASSKPHPLRLLDLQPDSHNANRGTERGRAALERSLREYGAGRAVLIDTGMLTSVYKGRASALEIAGDKLTAYYEDGKVTLQ